MKPELADHLAELVGFMRTPSKLVDSWVAANPHQGISVVLKAIFNRHAMQNHIHTRARL